MFGIVDMDTVFAALDIMWKGMAGIFVTVLIIMICVMIMGKLGKKTTENEPENK